jgi:hypothetical protein
MGWREESSAEGETKKEKSRLEGPEAESLSDYRYET